MRLHPRPTRCLAIRGAVLPALLLAPLAACVRGTIPPTEHYRLRPAPVAASTATPDAVHGGPVDALLAPAAAEQRVHVEPYATPGIYGEPRLVYREEATRYGTYPYREWAIPLGHMLATLTMETLRQQPGLAGRVDDGVRPATRGSLVWQGAVREFEEVNRQGRVYAAVRLDARLVHAGSDSVLWSGSARAEVPVTRATDMTAIVDSLSSLAAAAVATFARDAGPALHRATAARGVARGVARAAARPTTP